MNTTDHACLLIHGFGGTPFEVSFLAKAVQDAGIDTVTPVLAGHGATVKDFRASFFVDWFATAEQELVHLLAKYSRVSLAGFSMGGSIALLLAARYPVTRVASISAPFFSYISLCLQRKTIFPLLAPLGQYILPTIKAKTPSPESNAIAPSEGITGIFCLPQFVSLMQGITLLRKEIRSCTCPALLLHDLRDRVSGAENALAIAKAIGSEEIQLYFSHMRENSTSHHLIPTHQETRDWACMHLTKFLLSA